MSQKEKLPLRLGVGAIVLNKKNPEVFNLKAIIHEYLNEDKKALDPELILVPLLAYDRFHNRLGYGKGYYDRFLEEYIGRNKNILTIGLAFSFQKYKKIPVSKFDIKLDYILTEKGIF